MREVSERDRANDGREGERERATSHRGGGGKWERPAHTTRRDLDVCDSAEGERGRTYGATENGASPMIQAATSAVTAVRCLSSSFLRDLARLSRVLFSRFFFFFPPFRTFYRSRDEYQRSRSANETNCCTRPRAAHTPDATSSGLRLG